MLKITFKVRMRPKTTYKIDLNMQDLAALQHRQGHW